MLGKQEPCDGTCLCVGSLPLARLRLAWLQSVQGRCVDFSHCPGFACGSLEHRASLSATQLHAVARANLSTFASTAPQPSSQLYMAVGQNQWYHFGVGAPTILVDFSGDWDVYWERLVLAQCRAHSMPHLREEWAEADKGMRLK